MFIFLLALPLAPLRAEEPPRSAQFEQELAWVRSSQPQLSVADAEYLAAFISKYPPASSTPLRTILSYRAGIDSYKRPALEKIVNATLKSSPPETEADALAAKLRQEEQRAQTFFNSYLWYRKNVPLSETAARKAASFTALYPPDVTGNIQSCVYNRARVLGATPQVLSGVLEHLKSIASPETKTEELSARFIKESARSGLFETNYSWARATFNTAPASALKIAALAEHLPQDYDARSFQQILLWIAAVEGNSDSTLAPALTELRSAITGVPPTQVSASLQRQYERARALATVYGWARHNQKMDDELARETAAVFARYPADEVSKLQSILQYRLGIQGMDPEAVRLLLAQLLRDIPPTAGAATVTSKVDEELTRSSLFDSHYTWATNTLRLPRPAALKTAAALARYPGEIQSSVRYILQYRLTEQSTIDAVLARLKERVPPGPMSGELSAKADAEYTKASRFQTFYQWARTTLKVPHESALRIGAVGESVGNANQNTLMNTLIWHTQVVGTSNSALNPVLSRMERSLNGVSESEAAKIVQEESVRASNLSGTYAWARATMDDKTAMLVAEAFAPYPVTVQNWLQTLLTSRIGVYGSEKETIREQLKKLHQAAPPSPASDNANAVTQAVQKEAIRAQNLYSIHQWAHDKMHAPPELARKLAEQLQDMDLGTVAARQREIETKLAAEGTGLELLEAIQELGRRIEWELDRAGKKVIGCVETNALEPGYRKRRPRSVCETTLKDKTQWIDKAANRCGRFTEGGVMLEELGADQCDSIVSDIRPCVIRTSKPLRFYHYTTLSKIQRTIPSGLTLEEGIRDHAKLWAAHALEPHAPGNSGLYTAIDPYATQSFGADPFGRYDSFYLYRVELPTGTGYVNAGTQDGYTSCFFSPESIKRLQEAGCPTDVAHFVQNEYEPLPKPSCIPLLKKTFKALKLRGWAYNYSAARLADCTGPRHQAFVWIDLEDLPPNAVQLFTSTPPASGSAAYDEAVEIEKIFAEQGGSRWSSLRTAIGSGGRDLKTIKGDWLLGCENLAPQPAPEPEPAAEACTDCSTANLQDVRKTAESLKATVEATAKAVPKAGSKRAPPRSGKTSGSSGKRKR